MLPDDMWLRDEDWPLDYPCAGCELPLVLRGYDRNVIVHLHAEIKELQALTITCACGATTYLPLGKYVDVAHLMGCPDVRVIHGDPPDHLMARACEAGISVPFIPAMEPHHGVISASTWDWYSFGSAGQEVADAA